MRFVLSIVFVNPNYIDAKLKPDYVIYRTVIPIYNKIQQVSEIKIHRQISLLDSFVCIKGPQSLLPVLEKIGKTKSRFHIKLLEAIIRIITEFAMNNIQHDLIFF